jgi:hypothetical protein
MAPIKAPQGIKLAVIANSTTACGGCVSGADDMTQAAKLLNWNVKVFNGNADPITPENVARNIFGIMWTVWLCGRRGQRRMMAGAIGNRWRILAT